MMTDGRGREENSETSDKQYYKTLTWVSLRSLLLVLLLMVVVVVVVVVVFFFLL